MKTNLEKLFLKASKTHKQKLKAAELEYQKFLKEFITEAITGKNGFKEAYEIGEYLYHDKIFLDGGISREEYPKHVVMEEFIQSEIYMNS